MEITKYVMILLILLGLGKVIPCFSCADENCHSNHKQVESRIEPTVQEPSASTTKTQVEEEAPVVAENKVQEVEEVVEDNEEEEEEEEEDFDPKKFAEFAEKLRNGDIDTTIRVIDDKDEV